MYFLKKEHIVKTKLRNNPMQTRKIELEFQDGIYEKVINMLNSVKGLTIKEVKQDNQEIKYNKFEEDFRGAVREVKDIIDGKIDRKNVKSLDDLLTELK